jgi:nucleoside-diphosphate-sugar epimerase
MSQAAETVLITGAAGLIGSRLCRAFPNHEVVALDVKPLPEEAGRVHDYRADLTSAEDVHDILGRVRQEHGPRLAAVLHLAAYYDFSGAPSPLYRELTVEGTRRLLRGLQSAGFAVDQFVFSSTLLAMQPTEPGKELTESSPTSAEWAYPESKLQAERVIHEERGPIHSVILRIAGVYDEQCHSLPLSQQIARIYERKLEGYFFPGDAGNGQALIHLDDLTRCFQCCVRARDRLPAEDTFLIAEPDVQSYAELQQRLGELIHGDEWPAIRIPKPLAKAGAWARTRLAREGEEPFIQPWMIDLADDHYAVSIQHACAKLNWRPERRLRDTLPAMIAFLKRDPAGFYAANGLPAAASAS